MNDDEAFFPTPLPSPKYQLDVPPSGWFKTPQAIAGQVVWARIREDVRLAAIGLHIAGIGHVMTHDDVHGFIPDAVLSQVAPVPLDQLRMVVAELVAVGLWAEGINDGLRGYVVGGAENAVAARKARSASAQVAGSKSQEGRRAPRQPIRGELLADRPTDWSKVSEDL